MDSSTQKKNVKKAVTPTYEFHEIMKNTTCKCGCGITFTDWKSSWKCHMCNYCVSDRKWVYTNTQIGSGFKLVCPDCAKMMSYMMDECT
jgi:hypothetical protein